MRRRTRLRTTAPPTDFETETAKTTRAGRVADRVGRRGSPSAGTPASAPHEGDLARAPQRLVPAHAWRTRLDGQALAALFAARREHVAAVLRAHALEEAMDALAPAIVGLKSAFHVLAPNGEKGPLSIASRERLASTVELAFCERFPSCPHLFTMLWRYAVLRRPQSHAVSPLSRTKPLVDGGRKRGRQSLAITAFSNARRAAVDKCISSWKFSEGFGVPHSNSPASFSEVLDARGHRRPRTFY